jgi:hypothetical protein
VTPWSFSVKADRRKAAILGVGRERRRENVGSADILPPEDVLAAVADLTPEQRSMLQLALQLTKKTLADV